MLALIENIMSENDGLITSDDILCRQTIPVIIAVPHDSHARGDYFYWGGVGGGDGRLDVKPIDLTIRSELAIN